MNKQFQVSYFDKNICNLTHNFTIELQRLHRGITTYQPFKIKVEFLREYYKKFGKQAYKELRAGNLEYFMPSGVWSDRTKTGQLLKPSGLAQIDVDDISDSKELQRIKNILSNDKHTALLFESPSGLGLKCLTHISTDNPLPNFVGAVLCSYFKDNYNIDIDPAPAANLKGACYISYDPTAYLNLSATPLIIRQRPTKLKRSSVIRSESVTASELSEREKLYLNSLIKSEAKNIKNVAGGRGGNTLYRAGLRVGSCKNAGIDTELARKSFLEAFLSRESNHTEEEFDSIFDPAVKKGQAGDQFTIPDRPAVAKGSA